MVDNDNTNNKRLFLQGLSPKKGPILAAIIADILADGLTPIEIDNFANFITVIGDSMAL